MTDDPWKTEPPPAQPFAEGEKPLSIGELANLAVFHLGRIATAQEAMVRLAEVDLEATITHEVTARVEEAVNERLKKTTERNYIGRKG